MPEDKIIINREFGRKLTSLLGNPFIQIAIAIIMSIFFYLIATSSKMPYYFITTPNIVVKQHPVSLKLMLGDRKIASIYSVDLVIWNNGNEFIDQSDFMESRPTILQSREPIQFLACHIVTKSRQELQFSSKVKKDAVIFRLLGDDALEQGDGVVFRIYYTPNIPLKAFKLDSRIKGTKNGFEYIDLKRTTRSNHVNPLIIGWCVIIGLILVRSITLIIVKQPVVFRRKEIVFLCIALGIWTYYTYEYFYVALDLNWYRAVI